MSQTPEVGIKKDAWSAFRGLAWWQLVLTIGPLLLIPLGGLIGGLFGGAATAINLTLARKPINGLVKALVMVVFAVAAYVAYFTTAAAIKAALFN